MKNKNIRLLSVLVVMLMACSPATAPPATDLPPAQPSIAPTDTPLPSPTSTATPSTMKYYVHTGETCSMVAVAHQITLDQLLALNPGFKCSGIKAGDLLTIPLSAEVATLSRDARFDPTITPTLVIPTVIQPTLKPAATIAVMPTTKPAASGCPNGCTASSSTCLIKGNISLSGEKIYHVPGGSFYNATVITPSQGERWFCTEAEAQANGWRKAKN